eukprot:g3598.t1
MSAPAINPSVPTTAFVNARVLSCVRRDYEKIGGSCSSTSPEKCNGQDEQQLEHYCGFLVNARTGKILKMFKNASSLKMWKLDAAEIVDLQGKIVIPGLWDSHCHAYSLAHQAKVANLRNLGGGDADHPQRPGTILDFQKRLVGKYEEILRNGRKVSTFLEGTGWDEADLEGGRLPSRWDLDGCANVGDRKINATNAAVDVDSQLHEVHPELLELPIVCWRRCWHVLVCNSAALKIANITATTHLDVPGVDRDAGSNEPTGVLRENATALLQKILGKEDSFHEKVELLSRCVDQMPKAGVTGIQSNDTTLLGQISDAWAVWQAVMEKKTVNDHMLKADFARDGKPLLSLPTDAETTRVVDREKTAKKVVVGGANKAKTACSPPRIGGRSTSTSPPSQLSPYMDERAAPGSPAWRSRAAFSTDPRFNRNPLPVRVAWVAFWNSIPTTRRGGCKWEPTPMPMRPSDNSESAEQGSRPPAGTFSPGARNETVDGQPSELLPTSPDPAFLWSNRAKIILDGSLGASTAALLQPYSDDPANKNCGLLSVTEEEVETALKTVYAANYCLEAHVIGDAAFELLLRVLEKAAVDWHSRLVFTHCQIVNEDLLKRMAQLADREYEAVDEPRVEVVRMHKRIIASVQPQFTNSDLPVVEKKLGKARVATSYVWKRLKNEAKMVVVGGSDAPVEQLCPLAGISDVMRNALHAAENFSLAEALAAYTRDAAWAARRESDLGRLSEGYLADFVVLDLRVAAEDTTVEQELARAFTTERTAGSGAGVRVARTYVAGKLMYDREHQGMVGDAGDEVTEFVCDTNAPGRGGLPLWRCPCCVNLPTLPSL